MSLKFPISLVGKKGGSSLTEGLVDWWDGGSTIGQFAGNNIGYMGPNKTEHPSTFGGSWNWNQNKNGVFAGLGCSFRGSAGKQTIGLVIRKKSYSVNSYIIQAGAGGACRLSYNNDGYRLGSSYFNYGQTQRSLGNGWHLVLYQWDGVTRTGQTFFNDELVPYTLAPNQGNGSILRIGYNYGTSIEVAQIAYWNRWMTQEDADALYNDGAFTKYTDLPTFQESVQETYTYRSDGSINTRATGSVPYAWMNGSLNVYSIQFGTNTTTTGDRAFKNCENLVNVVIPEHITLIDTYSFESCSALRRVEIPRLTALPIDGGNPFHKSGAATIHLPVNHPTTATTAYGRTIIKDLAAL